jgi:hypothetical protein
MIYEFTDGITDRGEEPAKLIKRLFAEVKKGASS